MLDYEIRNTQVNMDGLLEVLGKNLYSTPAVVLRELIQNAHDACQRHKIETGQLRDYRIELATAENEGVLRITDNGSGLTRPEIERYLATIGMGYTRVLRDQTTTVDMIGYFGLGFLSAYVVGEHVEVHTTSYQTPDQTWVFSSAGGKTFSIAPGSSHPIGTTVVLKLKPEFSNLANARVIASLVGKYCSLLSISITLNGATEPLNNLRPPWLELPNRSTLQQKKQQLAFAELFDSDYSPIACIMIPDNALGLKGLMWIQDGGSYISSDTRKVSIFIRNMFITDKEPDLLPRWAGFVGGVFESPHFKPTASRESLQEDDYYEKVQALIQETLVTGLRELVLQEPETWKRILTRHNQALLGAAVSDNRLFEVTRRSVRLPTNLGDFTVAQLMRRSQGALYLKSEVAASSEDMLLRAQGIPLIKGYLYAVTAFCQKYSQRESVPLRNLGVEAEQSNLLQEVAVADSVRTQLEPHFVTDDVGVKFAEYEPASVPMVYFNNVEAMRKNRIESEEAAKRISSAALSLARLHTKNIARQKEKFLYVNLKNPTIKRLIQLEADALPAYVNILKCCIANTMEGEESESDSMLERLVLFNQSMISLMEN